METAIDGKAFRALSYGLYVVTSMCDKKANGQIANTVFQVTSDPPRMAVCINKENLTHACILKSGVFGVSVLEEDVPMPFIGRFGFKSGRDGDKLKDLTIEKGPSGCPLVTDHAVAVVEAKVVDQVDAGTHTLFIGEVSSARVLNQKKPLTYAAYHEKKRGKTPPKAPTYQAD
jgi:ferric-chelate reductase [NAD(P)H]